MNTNQNQVNDLALGLSYLNTTKQFQAFLGLKDDHAIRHSRSTGYLLGKPAPKHIKIGRNIRYKKEDILEWLSQFQTEETAING